MADNAPKPKTVSILQTLAVLPSGIQGPDLDTDELSKYLERHYKTLAEDERNAHHRLRDELYRDGGLTHIKSVIRTLFKDPTVRELRSDVAPYAQFNNVIKRIVNEMSTVYSEPARRMVGETEETEAAQIAQVEALKAGAIEADAIKIDTPNNDAYQAVLEAVCMDERMVEVGRLLNLHRALLVGFRVRMRPNGDREPTIDIATPGNVRAITHPNDESLVIGWLIRTCHKTARDADVPAWMLWTDHESVALRENLSVIPGTHHEHGLGVCPWVPVTLGPPSSGFWPGNEGADLVAGHTTIWLENILLIKESKSATKQTIITGDGTNTGRGQTLDTEVPSELSDGQSASTVDMSMDLDLFKGAAGHVLDSLALNYGLSPAVARGQHAESAEARELQMLPLKGIRRRQQIPLRRFEFRFAVVMAAVLAVDLPAMKFEVEDWRIEFAESETPLDPVTEQDLFEKRRAAGLDNTVDMIVRKRPGLTEDGAWEIVDHNIAVETKRNAKMRPLMAISGSMGAATPDGNKPTFEQNRGDAQDETEKPKPGSGEDTTE